MPSSSRPSAAGRRGARELQRAPPLRLRPGRLLLRLRRGPSGSTPQPRRSPSARSRWRSIMTGIDEEIAERRRHDEAKRSRPLAAVPPPPARRVLTTSARQVERSQVDWLEPGRIPLGQVTVVAGVGGMGKSQFTCLLAARVSRGELGAAGDVLIATAEDDPSTTVRPRLEAVQAELDRVHFLTIATAEGETRDHDPRRRRAARGDGRVPRRPPAGDRPAGGAPAGRDRLAPRPVGSARAGAALPAGDDDRVRRRGGAALEQVDRPRAADAPGRLGGVRQRGPLSCCCSTATPTTRTASAAIGACSRTSSATWRRWRRACSTRWRRS